MTAIRLYELAQLHLLELLAREDRLRAQVAEARQVAADCWANLSDASADQRPGVRGLGRQMRQGRRA